MSLFQRGDFKLHSGMNSAFKIDCDFLTDSDIDTIAEMLSKRLTAFSYVEGVPRGGLRLATAMKKYTTPAAPFCPFLIVDDIFTTGRSMEEHRAGRSAIGAVIFARNETPA